MQGHRVTELNRKPGAIKSSPAPAAVPREFRRGGERVQGASAQPRPGGNGVQTEQIAGAYPLSGDQSTVILSPNTKEMRPARAARARRSPSAGDTSRVTVGTTWALSPGRVSIRWPVPKTRRFCSKTWYNWSVVFAFINGYQNIHPVFRLTNPATPEASSTLTVMARMLADNRTSRNCALGRVSSPGPVPLPPWGVATSFQFRHVGEGAFGQVPAPRGSSHQVGAQAGGRAYPFNYQGRRPLNGRFGRFGCIIQTRLAIVPDTAASISQIQGGKKRLIEVIDQIQRANSPGTSRVQPREPES